jgi:hypothetical protein
VSHPYPEIRSASRLSRRTSRKGKIEGVASISFP